MPRSPIREPSDAVRAAHHQIGNSLQSVASLLALQGRESEPRTAAALFEASRRVSAIMRLHQRLQATGADVVRLDGLLEDVCKDVAEIAETPRPVTLGLDLAPLEARSATASALALIAAELVGNALEHAFTDGGSEVRVELRACEAGCRLTVQDDGRQAAPRPVSPGFGLTLVARLVRQLHGTGRQSLTTDGGVFTVTIPGPAPARA